METGPLDGVRIIELAGLGALPFGALKLADMGAEVIRVDRASEVPDDKTPRPHSSFDRGRRSIAVDLKHPDGVATVLRLAEHADALLESFRPGVAERLGVGPDAVLARNPRIVYGRLTGWGQHGTLAHAAGHSLNYEALTGWSRAVGPAGGPPVPTLMMAGDFAGGGLNLAYGVVCALFEAQRSGTGQVVDANMCDGVQSLMGVMYGMADSGMHTDELGSNLFDGGCHFYAIYETSDGKYVSVAPIEPHFYAVLLDHLGLTLEECPQWPRERWPEVKARFAEVFATRTRDEWCELLEGTDACFAPVLTFGESRTHHHNVSRGVMAAEGGTEVIPVPRLSRTPGTIRPSPAHPGADTDGVLGQLGWTGAELAALRSSGAIA